ncbi:hypothetical protein AB0I81_10245 [Nonomuraea sp. NPDC050404]|uniref:hypothetical protein n=1 Tax=Nonomuraea sp. NPDC050404 TaxID=3155783 RepID=UPI0033D0EEB6
MRGGGHSEPLVMLGYLVGMTVTPFVRQLAYSVSDSAVLGQFLVMCEVLFPVAFLIGLAGLLFRAGRWLLRRLVMRGDETA